MNFDPSHKMGLNMLVDIVILDYDAFCPIQAKNCTCWQLSHADYLLSLPFLMAVAAQNTNNTTIRSILLAEKLTSSNFTNWYRNLRIVLSMYLDLQRTLEKYNAYDMLKELKTMFEEHAKQELFEIVKAFNACKPEEVQSVSSYLLKMKSYLDTLERLGYDMPNELGIVELHVMLKLHEKGVPKKAETPVVLAIREAQDPPPHKRDNLAKDSICHHCKEVGHWKRNCPSYQDELKKRKNVSIASTLSIFTIELYAFPNKTWVYDMGFGTHICNTSQGLRGSRKLKHGALSLYMGNGMRAAVEAIGSFDLVLPSGLIIVLNNCHFAPTITRGVVSIFRLVNNGYIHTFTNYGISVLKDVVFYFNAIPRDGIYEVDMHNLYPNVSYMFSVSNKRAKHALDSFYLWYCRLGHINKKRMDKLQRDGIL
ncbi:zinc finger, CCHC-type containing protein [Tanacetum coccineum]